LRDPLSTRQLRIRAEVALQAAIGLDAGRRERAEQLIAERLRDGRLPADQQRDVVLILLDIPVDNPARKSLSAATLTKTMSRTMDQSALGYQAWALSAVAVR